jgi:uncharacterized membrane protein
MSFGEYNCMLEKILHTTAGWWIAVICVVLLAIGWRLPLLNGSFWLDEAAQALESARPWSQQLQIRDDFQPPLLHVMLHFALYGGRDEAWLRTVGAVVPGVLTVMGVMLVGKTLHSPKAGVFAGVLLATSSFHTFFSQELRPYALPAAFTVWSWWLLWRGRSHAWSGGALVGYWLLTLGGLYSSYLYPFVFFGQLAYVSVGQFQFKKTWQLAIVPVLGMLPWLPSFYGQLQAGQLLREQLPGWEDVVSFPVMKALALTAAKFLFGPLDVELTWQFGLPIVLLALLGAKLVFMARHQGSFGNINRVLLWWIGASVLAACLVSIVIPVIQPKRILWLLPAVYLVVAMTTTLRPVRSRMYAALFAGLFLTLNITSSYAYWTTPRLQREDWRGLVATLTQRFPAHNTMAVFSFPAPFAGWEWYNQGHFESRSTGRLLLTQQSDAQQIGVLTPTQTVLVFDYLRTLTDPQDQLLSYVESQGYRQRDVIDVPNIGFVRMYQANPQYAYRY